MIEGKKRKLKRRTYGIHFTPKEIFKACIFPEIKDLLYAHAWMDLYCGEGNLIFPILEAIPSTERIDFFQEHVFLSDIQDSMVQVCKKKAQLLNIPLDLINRNIFKRDNLNSFPDHLKTSKYPLFHVTNPPYLYLGYIKKHPKTAPYLKYFQRENKGYQDLYQIAMMRDLKNGIQNMIYIIPSNFLFGATVSNKFRKDFLKYYFIKKMYIFETPIFEFTGTNICIGFFTRKKILKNEPQIFKGMKIKKKGIVNERVYHLKPENHYRGGTEFDEFTKKFKTFQPIQVKYYLLKEEVEQNKGNQEILVIDTNAYVSNNYEKRTLKANEFLRNKVQKNILYVRTVDTGSLEGRVGLYLIKKDFNVDGIYVSKATYRTCPIQLFLTPTLVHEDQVLLKNYFNFMLEYFREKTDSEFLTTYKYSNAEYTRKYLGLTQVRKLIETFPLNLLDAEKKTLKDLININKPVEVMRFLSKLKSRKK